MEHQYRSRAGSLVDARPVDIIVGLEINIDSLGEFRAAIEKLRNNTKAESGCNRFEVLQGDAENKFVLVEQYANQSAVDAHTQTQHIKDWGTFLYGKKGETETLNLVRKTVAKSKVRWLLP
jgi:quinol monooxygenase YgiN